MILIQLYFLVPEHFSIILILSSKGKTSSLFIRNTKYVTSVCKNTHFLNLSYLILLLTVLNVIKVSSCWIFTKDVFYLDVSSFPFEISLMQSACQTGVILVKINLYEFWQLKEGGTQVIIVATDMHDWYLAQKISPHPLV